MAAIRVGTSGFAYKEWKPSFYPASLGDKEFLGFYASHFNAVEIDRTYYRMPNRSTLDGWAAATPPHFRFALKASQKITHWERLKVPSESLAYWLKTVPLLGERLGVVLYQLPPRFPRDVDRLKAFLDALPPSPRSAFEFRDNSWCHDDVFRLLADHKMALCIHDSDEGTTPLELTTDLTYVRLRRTHYDETQREDWRERLRAWGGGGVEVFAFIKHEDNPDAPLIAQAFARGLATSG